MEKITIFCDGASKGNPGPGGWGAIVAAKGHVHELGGFESTTTNNRMELTAAVRALEEARTFDDGHVVVHTDSSYVINGITKWVQGWQKNGWVTKTKDPVMNQDLWQELVTAVEKFSHEVEWKYVGGHVGIAGNERVDTIASNHALGLEVDLHRGPHDTYTIDIHSVQVDEAKQKQKSSSNSRSKAKAYSYVSMVEGVVMTHKTWAECEARVKGKAARFKKALNAEEEAEIIKDFSN